jgi:hypothetical protein
MKTVLSQDLLKSRRKEVTGYLRFLEKALETNAEIQSPGAVQLPLELELTHTLKANTYLLLYNTIEALMTQLLAEIHDEIKASNATLDDLNPKLYLEVIRKLKSGEENIAETFSHPSGRPFLDYWLRDYEKRIQANRNPHFSGNIDGMRIKIIGLKYGFATGDDVADAKLTHKALQDAKNHRNTLAHGEKSFTDLGRSLSYAQIRDDAVATLRTLNTIRLVVDDFLAVEGYRRPSPNAAELVPAA